jgi:hypothetical protein
MCISPSASLILLATVPVNDVQELITIRRDGLYTWLHKEASHEPLELDVENVEEEENALDPPEHTVCTWNS